MGSKPIFDSILDMDARQQEPTNFQSGSTPLLWPDFNSIPTARYGEHRSDLKSAYQAVRSHSKSLTRRFSETEQQIQSMPDASPTKWHLAHTSWFFETFILEPFKPDFKWFDEDFCYLFNSYYNAIGKQYPRAKRGLITNPDLKTVWAFRNSVDEQMSQLLEVADDDVFQRLAPVLVLGLNHEQQHQELITTDIQHALYQSEKRGPENRGRNQFLGNQEPQKPDQITFLECPGGRHKIGYAGDGFCFDNEMGQHEVLLPAFRISKRLVSSGQWLAFMNDDGYQRPLLWLSDGWQWKQENKVDSPLYWKKTDDTWAHFGLDGWATIDPNEPVIHISYYEADAFAQWAGSRLPRESEWECMANWEPNANDCFSDTGRCWEWTQSAYSAYPGFRPTPGAAGEYNGKFMVNQMVLRGSSPATASYHSRPSYRNFFYPEARWQFTGIRLAKDVN